MWCWRDRGMVVVTSENFDGEWIARIIQRFGFGVARGSSTRGGARALRQLLRTAARRAGRLHGRRPARARAGWRSRAWSGWRRRPATRSSAIPLRSRPGLDHRQLGSHADPQAVQPAGDGRGAGAARGRRRRRRRARGAPAVAVEAAAARRRSAVPAGPGGRRDARMTICSAASGSRITSRRPAIPSGPSAPRRCSAWPRAWARPRPRAGRADPGRRRRRSRACTPRPTSPRSAPRPAAPCGSTPTRARVPSRTRWPALAAGAAIAGVRPRARRLRAGPAVRAGAAARPSRRGRAAAMGFCLFNNVAVAAARARAAGLARVAIVDFDVHHGNGTQAAFYDDPSVLFVSSHQYPVLPGHRCGAPRSARGAGAGFTVNLPLEAGAGDADLDEVYPRRGRARARPLRARAGARVGRLRRARRRPAGRRCA